MTIVAVIGSRVYADSMMMTGDEMVPDYLGKILPVDYIPIWEDRDADRGKTPPYDHLLGVTYTGSAHICKAALRMLQEGMSLPEVRSHYDRTLRLGLARNPMNNTTLFFIGVRRNYRLSISLSRGEVSGVDAWPKEADTTNIDAHGNWCGGSGTDDFAAFIRGGFHPLAAIIRTIERQSETCGGLIEVWKFDTDEKNKAPIFYREGILNASDPSYLTIAMCSKDVYPLDWVAAEGYIDRKKRVAKAKMLEISKRWSQDPVDTSPAQKPKTPRRKKAAAVAPASSIPASAEEAIPLAPEANKPIG